MSGSGRESLPEVREWSVGPPGCTGVIGSPSQMSQSVRHPLTGGWEAFPDVREWSGDHPGYPDVVGRPFRMSGSGLVALLDVREWSGGPA